MFFRFISKSFKVKINSFAERPVSQTEQIKVNVDDGNTNFEESVMKTRRYRYLYHLIDTFLKQWQAEQLRELREKQQRHSRSNSKDQISTKVNVLIQQDKSTRNNWKIVQMTKLNKGRGNFVSAANIEDIKNNEKVIITRPITKRNPVELAYNKAEIKLEFVDEKYISFVQNI